ncbi:NAD-binding protein [Candidatus Woesearchaeota archaeon]|nr:NAD-binding protein [Candidatus Woesearchaeota archaeon]
MKIIIAGGGHIGRSVAEKLIPHEVEVTLIERDARTVASLSGLDALVVEGDCTDYNLLKEVDIHSADVFLAVTNRDSINMVACSMVRKLSKCKIICKVEEQAKFFKGDYSARDLGIDQLISPKRLLIDKILSYIHEPILSELIEYPKEKARVIGIKIAKRSPYVGKELDSSLFPGTTILGVSRQNTMYLPPEIDRIQVKDRVYIIGLEPAIERMEASFKQKKTKQVIVLGTNQKSRLLAKTLKKEGFKVYMLDRDKEACERTAMEDIYILNSSATKGRLLKELDIENSCMVALSNDDEYNMIASIFAKRHGAPKTICYIKNQELLKLATRFASIDNIISSDSLAIDKIIRFCLKNIISDVDFAGMDGEIVEFIVDEKQAGKKVEEFLEEGIQPGLVIRENKQIPASECKVLREKDRVIALVKAK